MKERPILFSAPMVRALLSGAKTQTRRVVKPQPTKLIAGLSCIPVHIHPDDWAWSLGAPGCSVVSCKPNGPDGWALENSPYGQPGERLWVKETIRKTGEFPDGYATSEYVADGAPTVADAWPWQRRTLVSIHCPRGLSRINLEIVSVRVERLQSISEVDAIAEGLDFVPDGAAAHGIKGLATSWSNDPRKSYRALWESINGPGSWEANPWVWVVEFKRIP